MVSNEPKTSRHAQADKTLLSEGQLKPFSPDDIPHVASLHDRIFEGGEGKPSNRLCEYFEELFFNNPWVDPLVPSWVYKTNKGDIKAFAASHPRRMMFDGEPIMAADDGSWMVAEDYRGRGLGSLMARHILEMGPVLSYGDTGGRPAIAIWESFGGARVQIGGVQWEYVLRTRRLNNAAKSKPGFVRFPNRILNGIRFYRRRAQIQQQVGGARVSEVAPDVLERLPEMLPTSTRLYPRYDAAYVSWLIKVASSVVSRGELRHSVVASQTGGDIDGWYFFWGVPNSRAEVLQIVSKPGAEARVLAQLIAHAAREGAASVAGSWSGHGALIAAQDMGCHIGYLATRTVTHTRNTEIMRAIMCGDYFLSAFEGDHWLERRNR